MKKVKKCGRECMHQVEDDQDTELEIENAEINLPRNLSPEQIFWFELAGFKVDKRK